MLHLNFMDFFLTSFLATYNITKKIKSKYYTNGRSCV